MKDRDILEITHAALYIYQKQQKEPSEKIARVVLAVEIEMQELTICSECGRVKREL